MALLTQLGEELKSIAPAYLKVTFTFRLWWVQVFPSPSCMIVQIPIPGEILNKILGHQII